MPLTRRQLTGTGFAAAITGGGAFGVRAKEMMMTDATALNVPAQVIPPPKSLSTQAQSFLSLAAARITASGGAPATVQDGAKAALQMLRPMAERFDGSLEALPLPGGAKLYRVQPRGMQGRQTELAYLDIHGGGFVGGGGEAKLRAMDYGVTIYAVDYRLAPEHRYPAALDDCMHAYREVLKRHGASSLIVGGASAGGNLAAAVMLRAKGEGLALPKALLLLTPALDLARTGDTYATNRFLDVNLYGGAEEGPAAYAGGADPKTPYLSPLYGDVSGGWPPTLLSSGTRDLLLSDTVRMHRALRRAGVAAELHVTEAGPHGGFMGSAPEDQEIMAECRRFVREAWGLQD